MSEQTAIGLYRTLSSLGGDSQERPKGQRSVRIEERRGSHSLFKGREGVSLTVFAVGAVEAIGADAAAALIAIATTLAEALPFRQHWCECAAQEEDHEREKARLAHVVCSACVFVRASTLHGEE